MPSLSDLPVELSLKIFKAALVHNHGLAHAITPLPICNEDFYPVNEASLEGQSVKPSDPPTDRPIRRRFRIPDLKVDSSGLAVGYGFDDAHLTGEQVLKYDFSAPALIRQCALGAKCSNLPDAIIARILFWTRYFEEQAHDPIENHFLDRTQRTSRIEVSHNQYDLISDWSTSYEGSVSSNEESSGDPTDDGALSEDSSNEAVRAANDMDLFDVDSSDDSCDSEMEDKDFHCLYEASHTFLMRAKFHPQYGGAKDTFMLRDWSRQFGYQHSSQHQRHANDLCIDRSTTHMAMTAAALLRVNKAARLLTMEAVTDTIKHYQELYGSLEDRKRSVWYEMEAHCLMKEWNGGVQQLTSRIKVPTSDNTPEMQAFIRTMDSKWNCDAEQAWYIRLIAELSFLALSFSGRGSLQR